MNVIVQLEIYIFLFERGRILLQWQQKTKKQGYQQYFLNQNFPLQGGQLVEEEVWELESYPELWEWECFQELSVLQWGQLLVGEAIMYKFE